LVLSVAQKVESSRKLLIQALTPTAVSRDLLARAAFEHATEARRLYERTDTLSPELDALLQDAAQKGRAQVALMMDVKGAESAATNQVDHAAEAKSFLEFILPDLSESTANLLKQNSPDDISTLGFDNTYVGKGASKDFDIFSMSSLNEILDGPMEEDPYAQTVIKHRILPDESESRRENKSSTAASKKVSALFGGMFRAKAQVSQELSKELTCEPVEAAMNVVQKTITTPPRKQVSKRWSVKSFSPGRKANQSASAASVLYDDGTGLVGGAMGEIANIEELEKIKALDEKLNKTLKEAIDTDDTESLTSFHGVAIHGKEKTPEKNEEKRKNEKIALRESVRDIAVERTRAPPRVFEKVKPSFVAAPRGDPQVILASKSWESFVSENMPPVMVRSRSHDLEEVLLTSPASTAADSADKYTVASAQDEKDRYKVSEDEESFEAFWNPCSPRQLSIVPTVETCISALGMGGPATTLEANSANTKNSFVEKSAVTESTVATDEPDKYAPTRVDPATTLVVLAKADEAESLDPVFMSRGDIVNKSTEASTAPTAKTTKKKLKMAGVVAGLFGRKEGSNVARSLKSSKKVTPVKPKRETPSKPTSRLFKRQKEVKTNPEQPLLVSISVVPNDEEENETAPTRAGPVDLDDDCGDEEEEKTVQKEEAEEGASSQEVSQAAVHADDDPLVQHIKTQAMHHRNRGLDPAAADE
jgi:hypothetical protein